MIVYCNGCLKNVRVSEESTTCPQCGGFITMAMNWTKAERKEKAKERRRTGERVQRKTKSVYCDTCLRTVSVTLQPGELFTFPGGSCPYCSRWIDIPAEPVKEKPSRGKRQPSQRRGADAENDAEIDLPEPIEEPYQPNPVVAGVVGFIVLALLCAGVVSLVSHLLR